VGLTYIDVEIANPAKPRRAQRLTLWVDSGALYSVVPASVLRKLGVKPHSRRSFILADGTKITRRIGDLFFRLNGQQGASPVIFGEKDDSALLGSVSLEALGLMLDPLKRQLRPLPMLLAATIPHLSSRGMLQGQEQEPAGKGDTSNEERRGISKAL
jgi:predicted aspartyl protease